MPYYFGDLTGDPDLENYSNVRHTCAEERLKESWMPQAQLNNYSKTLGHVLQKFCCLITFMVLLAD